MWYELDDDACGLSGEVAVDSVEGARGDECSLVVCWYSNVDSGDFVESAGAGGDIASFGDYVAGGE